MKTWRREKLNRKKSTACALLFCFVSCVLFSCCVSTKKNSETDEKNANETESSKNSEENVQKEEIRENYQTVSFQEEKNTETLQKNFVQEESKKMSVAEFYDSMVKTARNSFDDSQPLEKEFPEWLSKLEDDGTYFYAVGAAGRFASEQRSREMAVLEAQSKLYDAAKIFQPDVAKPRVNGYTHISTYTQKIKNPETGKSAYVSAALIRIPRERIVGSK